MSIGWLVEYAFLRSSVSGRRTRVEHLQWITAANRAGNDSGHFTPRSWWRRFFALHLLRPRWGSEVLRGNGNNEGRKHKTENQKGFHKVHLSYRTPRYFLPAAIARPKLATDGLS
jgi:hypothetical protein